MILMTHQKLKPKRAFVPTFARLLNFEMSQEELTKHQVSQNLLFYETKDKPPLFSMFTLLDLHFSLLIRADVIISLCRISRRCCRMADIKITIGVVSVIKPLFLR